MTSFEVCPTRPPDSSRTGSGPDTVIVTPGEPEDGLRVGVKLVRLALAGHMRSGVTVAHTMRSMSSGVSPAEACTEYIRLTARRD